MIMIHTVNRVEKRVKQSERATSPLTHWSRSQMAFVFQFAVRAVITGVNKVITDVMAQIILPSHVRDGVP